ncbi:MAG: tetratricopeptide repeat protein [Candidatus Hydrogenedentes bacterium]|nr:tetratricopeptide repeat protein [Candidatus Hydrogenedentota bacterium]
MNILDLLDYVEKNPKDYEKRWILAKKLYQNKDYHLALEHLRVLKEEWEPKVNVIRFLSAALYRLGKYEEAIEELRNAIKHWPDEQGLYEQLGRVLVTAQRYEEALNVYEELIKIVPNHRWAQLAVDKLKRILERKTLKRKTYPVILATDFDLLPETICKRCGADNPKEEKRCWKCGETLSKSTNPPTIPSEGTQRNLYIMLTPEILTLALGIILVSSLALNLFLSIKFWINPTPNSSQPSLSFWELYQNQLIYTRILTGFGLISASYLFVKLGFKLLGIKDKISPNIVVITSLLIASFYFLCTWLPKDLIVWGIIFTPFITFILIFGALGIPPLKALNLTLFYVSSTILFVILSSSIIESYRLRTFINPITQFPSVVKYFANQKEKFPLTVLISSPDGLPIKKDFTLESSGSYWLDLRAKEIQISLFFERSDGFTLEINKGETNPIIYDKLKSEKWITKCTLQEGDTYTIKVFTDNKTPFTIKMESLLPLKIK